MAPKLGLVGGGVMGTAILSRLLAQQIYRPDEVLVSEPRATQRAELEAEYGVLTTESTPLAAEAEVLLLAIKPQIFGVIAQQLMRQAGQFSEQLVLSILAGTPLSHLETGFAAQPIVRAMPNTPATVGAGCTAIAPNAYVKPYHLAQARRIFEAVGQVVEVPESMMDAVTGLSGSGPAYVALMVEALADGGVRAGLPRAIAQQLALQTVRGTAELLAQTGQHPAVLKDQVTSPGGTTIAGVAALEQAGFRSALIEAVRAASLRSQELGKL
ncbi:MAG: pyrroline-5-carboxylate reductase [Synechococcales cyanobacterium CRU_2_2]|nr:pyrroline-5-carboxylate reductase [Synechococcales cyanobacterium CRU_2_2]